MSTAWNVSDWFPALLLGAGVLAVLVIGEAFITWFDRRANLKARAAREAAAPAARKLPPSTGDNQAVPLPWSRSGGNYWPEGFVPPEARVHEERRP